LWDVLREVESALTVISSHECRSQVEVLVDIDVLVQVPLVLCSKCIDAILAIRERRNGVHRVDLFVWIERFIFCLLRSFVLLGLDKSFCFLLVSLLERLVAITSLSNCLRISILVLLNQMVSIVSSNKVRWIQLVHSLPLHSHLAYLDEVVVVFEVSSLLKLLHCEFSSHREARQLELLDSLRSVDWRDARKSTVSTNSMTLWGFGSHLGVLTVEPLVGVDALRGLEVLDKGLLNHRLLLLVIQVGERTRLLLLNHDLLEAEVGFIRGVGRHEVRNFLISE
jgi:hypothetical protein